MVVSKDTAVKVMRIWFSRPSSLHDGSGVIWKNSLPILSTKDAAELANNDDFLIDLYQKITGATVQRDTNA